jgi:hypothetical protein
MLNNVSPSRPDNRVETSANPLKPQGKPRTDDFRKTFRKEREPSAKDEEELAPIEKEDSSPSVFDLSKNKTKNKSALSKNSALKDQSSSSDLATRHPSPQDGDEQTLDFFAGQQETDSDIPQKPVEDTLLAIADETPIQENLQEMETLPSQVPGEIKKNLDQSQAKTMDAIRQQGKLLEQPQKSKKSEKSTFETKQSGQASKSVGQEKPDAAAVNAGLQPVAFQTEKAQEQQEVTRSATIKDLVNQIVDRIQVMRRENQTSTMITLRDPPLLEGATITLTTSDHAKREFNISFANLSPDAKLFLDRKLNEDSLTQSLERKGLVVHMLTTTTQAENLLNVESGQAPRDQQEQRQQQQQQKQQQSQGEEEEFT